MHAPKNFTSIIGYRADIAQSQAIEYKPYNSPLLLVTDEHNKRSPGILDKVTEDALLSGWKVQDFGSTPLYDKTSQEPEASNYYYRDETGSGVAAALEQILAEVKERVSRLLETNDVDQQDAPMRTLIIVEGLQKYTRKDKKSIMQTVGMLASLAGLVQLGVVVSSGTPQVHTIEKFNIEYVDVRFDRNSFQSAYPLLDHQRFTLSQLGQPERFAYIRMSRTDESLIVLPAMSRNSASETLRKSNNVYETLKKLLETITP